MHWENIYDTQMINYNVIASNDTYQIAINRQCHYKIFCPFIEFQLSKNIDITTPPLEGTAEAEIGKQKVFL